MRLVSRFGIVDIPYENAQLFLQGTFVMADCFGKEYMMAKYSTADKAIKAMEMARDAYCSLPVILQNVDVSEEVKEMLVKLKKNGIIVKTSDFNKKQEIEYVNNVVFQFPKDEEVEI